MKIGQTCTAGRWTGVFVCVSLGCSSGSGAANVNDGGADQSTQSISDAGTAIDSTSGDDGQSPPLTGGGPPDCFGPCCTIPQPGSACDAGDQDASCATSASCGAANAATLTLPFNLVCNGQDWVAVGGDCGDSGVADNGCPTSQPQNGTTCALDSGTSCQYGLQCSGTCDAGSPVADASADAGAGSIMSGTACASVSGKVGPAICRSGQWQTQSLGTCP